MAAFNQWHPCRSIIYTTYDVHREQDTINPHTHNNMMVLSHETESSHHPYWYTHMLQVFRAYVRHCGEESRNLSVQPMEILWVRWYGTVPGHRYGSLAAWLPKVGFVSDLDLATFRFLDPSLVI